MSIQKRFYLGIDLGGTNVRAGVVDNQGRLMSRSAQKSQASQGPDVGMKNLFEVADKALEQAGLSARQLEAIGLASAGPLDIPAGRLLYPPNLPGWEDAPIRQWVADHYGRPTVLQNDANAAAFGEHWRGAGQAAATLLLWTLGTGVGSGIIFRGEIVSGAHSHGSECGHIVIQMDGGRVCEGTRQQGTLEAYASAKSLVIRCQEELDAGRESILHERIIGRELTTILMAEAAEEGDSLATELIMDVARCLGVGTTNVMHTIDPEMVLFGGGMTFGGSESELGRQFLERIKREIKARAFARPYEGCRFAYAELGGDAGLIGAAGWARHTNERAKPG